MLGIGGVRALKAMGIRSRRLPPERRPRRVRRPAAHSRSVREGLDFDAALDEVRRTTVFTTHTPVAAGHDAFPFHLVETHLAGAWGDLGSHRERFLALGHYDNGGGPMFNMTALALRDARRRSTASASCTARSPSRCGSRSGRARRTTQLPVRFVTNGVHVPTWMSSEIAALLRDAPRPRLARAPRRPGAVSNACCRFPTRSCGARARRCARSCSTSSASARASGGARQARRRARRRGRDDVRSATR